jgi:hypothetical protein
MQTISIAFRRIGAQEELDNERKKIVRMRARSKVEAWWWRNHGNWV